jgi:hypothetical protein
MVRFPPGASPGERELHGQQTIQPLPPHGNLAAFEENVADRSIKGFAGSGANVVCVKFGKHDV